MGGGSIFLQQIKALVRKDFTVLRAHKRAMIGEIIFPLVTVAIACFMATFVTKHSGEPMSFWEDQGDQLDCRYWFLATGTRDFWQDYLSLDTTNCFSYWNKEQVDNETQMVDVLDEHWSKYSPSEQTGGASVMGLFKNYTANETSPEAFAAGPLAVYGYNFFANTFTALGDVAFEAFNTQASIVPVGSRMPNYNEQTQDVNIQQIFATSASMMFAFAFVPMAATMSGRLVDEKKSKIREHLRVMGVSSKAYILATLTTAGIRVTFVSVAIFVALLGFHPVSVGLCFQIFLTVLLYGFSLAGFAQILPAFVSRSSFSSGLVSFFVSIGAVGGPFVTLLPAAAQYPIALFISPVAVVYNVARMLGGMTTTLPISVGMIYFFLFFQVVFYAALSEYLYNINPGEYGVPKHPLFPVYAVIAALKSLGSASSSGKYSSTSRSDDLTKKLSQVEMPPTPSNAGNGNSASPSSLRNTIVVEDLVKCYGKNTDSPAVNKLSLDIHEKEIFALLGHNGAGKTTTISMLVGMISATDYKKASVLGHDLEYEMDAIRQKIGSCPQFDVLFDDLSAREHMQLFASIKGVDHSRVDDLICSLKLPVNDQKASTFSGGMKRRLSVGTALVGDSPVLFLDEPSSGLDPVSRRQLWELLRDEKKKGKTIVLTTHFMEEADYLGDRIAIMSHGRLYCCDTSTNLKRTYGVGFYLKLVKKTARSEHSPSNGDDQALDTNQRNSSQHRAPREFDGQFDKSRVEALLAKHLDQGKFHFEHESIGDCTFVLAADQMPKFGVMLQELEEHLESSYGCTSYGIAMNSLEDVFVTISEREAAKSASTAAPSAGDDKGFETSTNDDGEDMEHVFSQATYNTSWLARFVFQIWAVMWKKSLALRNKRLIIMTILVPILLVGIGYASVIPNFAAQGGSSNTYISQFSSNWPDMRDVTLSVIHDGPSDTDSTYEVMGTFQTVYAEIMQRAGFGGAHINIQYVNNLKDFQIGSFIDMRTISFVPIESFTKKYRPVIQLINGGFCLRPGDTGCKVNSNGGNNNNDFVGDVTGKNMTYDYTIMYDPTHYSSQPLIFFESAMRTAIEIVLRRNFPNDPKTLKRRPPVVIPSIDLKAWTPPPPPPPTPVPGEGSSGSGQETTPVPSTPAPTPDDNGNGGNDNDAPPFLIAPLGIFLVLMIGQYGSTSVLWTAEELNKKIFHTMRLHGCSAAAFWVGTLISDSAPSLIMVAATIGGCYARGVHQIQNSFLEVLCYAIILAVINVMLMAYALVLLLPADLKPNTYMYVVSGCYYLMMTLPLLALFAKTPQEWAKYCTPPRALFEMIMLDFHKDPSKVWTDPLMGKIFASFIVWDLPWIFVIVWKSYWSGRLDPAVGCCGGGVQDELAPSHPMVMGTEAANQGEQHNESTSLISPQNQQQQAAIGGVPAVAGVALVDPDVAAERARVAADPADNMVSVSGLQKVFYSVATAGSGNANQPSMCQRLCASSEAKLAVNDVTFGLRKGECFGLLGPNGAGKTTTVKMMLRELEPTHGDVQYPYDDRATDINNGPLGSKDEAYRYARLGVCQQHDSLWEVMTAEEHLHMYLKLRLGSYYSFPKYQRYVANAIRKVYLTDDAEGKTSVEYSGGMKRKLAVAIAMYTGARSVYLDEPSTGMDPYARRALWRSINEALQQERCVLLTTHSMEEADAVCARIAIVTNGRLQCIGNSQHLKNRFGHGYSVTLTLVPRVLERLASPMSATTTSVVPVIQDDAPPAGTTVNEQSVVVSESSKRLMEEAASITVLSSEDEANVVRLNEDHGSRVDKSMKKIFGDTCELKEVLGQQRRYSITTLPALSFAFLMLEESKEAWGLDAYTVSQLSSLEQIFINFAGSSVNEQN